MAEPDSDQQFRFFLISALCGALGVASGYAIFLNYDDISRTPWRSLAALIGAALVSYAIEWLRDVIRHGEIENETHPVVRSVGTFIVVLLFELFIGGFHGGLEMGPSGIMKTAVLLLGKQAESVEGVRWTVALVSGMWIVTGAVVACWLSMQIGRDEDKSIGRHIFRSARWGTIGGLALAPAIIGLYILGSRTLVTLLYFVSSARDVSKGYEQYSLGFQTFAANPMYGLVHLPVELLRDAAYIGKPFFWLCYLALYVALALMVRWRQHVARSSNSVGALNLVICGLLYCIFNPIVLAIWSVLKEMMHREPLGDLVLAVLLGAVVWAIPGLLLGGLIPLLKRAGRSPRSWAMIGYGAGALLIVISTVSRNAWPVLPAVIAVGSGLLFQRGMPVREFWPFAALCVAIGISGAMSVSQAFTFSEVLYRLHKIDDLRPTRPDSAATAQSDDAPADPDREKDARVLEISIAGCFGFWTTVGMLACWSMYEFENPGETDSREATAS
jgi:hypothetical protein